MRLFYLAFITLGLLLGTGCSPKDSPGTTCQISTITRNSTNPGNNYSESYQSQGGRLFRYTYTSSSGSTIYQFTFGSNGKLSRKANIADPSDYTDYTYDGNNRILSETYYYPGEPPARIVFSYSNSSSYPSHGDYYIFSNGSFIPDGSRSTFTWNNGNLVLSEFIEGTPPVLTTRFTNTYDSQRWHLASISNIGPIELIGQNNQITDRFQFFADSRDFTTVTNYTYNSQGFPITASETSASGVDSYVFTYSNCQ